MRRRDVLKAAGAMAAVGAGGCLDGEGFGADDTEAVWRYDVGARVEAVVDGRVVGREDWRRDGSGGVVALDADDGGRLWRYGETGGYSGYTALEFDGSGVYFGGADDEVGSGKGEVYALDLDGGERWKADVGSVYSSPVVDGGVVYVGSDRGRAYAFDAADCEELWSVEVGGDRPNEPSVEAVVEGVAYVAGGEALYALEGSSGDELWSYGEERVVRANGLAVEDGVVYVTEYGVLAAIADGEEVWRRELDGNHRLRGLAHGNLYVGSLYAIDPETAETLWRVEGSGDPALADDVVYVGGGSLRRVGDDGEVEWKQGFDGERDDGDGVEQVERVTVVDGDVYAVYGYGEGRTDLVHRVSADGAVDWTADSGGTVTGYAVGGDVYVGTIEDVKAYETG